MFPKFISYYLMIIDHIWTTSESVNLMSALACVVHAINHHFFFKFLYLFSWTSLNIFFTIISFDIYTCIPNVYRTDFVCLFMILLQLHTILRSYCSNRDFCPWSQAEWSSLLVAANRACHSSVKLELISAHVVWLALACFWW